MKPQGLIVDNFAGGGGASTGLEIALGRSPDIAINHDPEALALHTANHPLTCHLVENVWRVDPVEVCAGRSPWVAWFSPDCTFFSRAKGGKPLVRGRRVLAHVVVRWARDVRPEIIMLENVPEFVDWAPLRDGLPDPTKRGKSFRIWVSQLRNLGYVVEWRVLAACDFGAPTSRKRLFVVARRDGKPIHWPVPTHGPGRLPYRTAAECIDWSIPCPSIFDRKRPLAEATLRRIARGLRRYVLDNPQPYIVKNMTNNVPRGVDEPMSTILTGNHHLLVTPFIYGHLGRPANNDGRRTDLPYPTITTRDGYKMIAAFIAKHYGGHETDGAPLSRPMSTVTTQDHHHLVTVPFVPAGSDHRAEVRAFLMKYYGTPQDPRLTDPMHTIPTRDRFALVTVDGVDYEILDIGMRMLTPRELFRAQGFPENYQIDIAIDGRPLSKAAQVRMCGNSVCPPVAAALARANALEVGIAGGASQLDLFGEDVA